MKNLIFVDCEAYGACPALGNLTEFGAVDFTSGAEFHGVLMEGRPSRDNPAIPETPPPLTPLGEEELQVQRVKVFGDFAIWLAAITGGRRPIFVSDNVAFDWQWINDGFWRAIGRNPFGHSGRRISDFYAGLVGDFSRTQEWKSLRVTPHDHNPVHDARGNVEAFSRMLAGERGKPR